MVYYFTSNVTDPPITLFMGFDKYENEELIRWGWPEDVWFHVDKVSSAHVYLRLKPGQTIETLAKETIEDCAQLCKANSITGNKMNNVDVIYTMWSNLKKTPGMEPGQVSFHKDKEVYKIRLEKRINEIVNRLNKTKREDKPDFRALREERDRQERDKKKAEFKKQQEQEKVLQKQREEEAKLRSYDSLMQSENMTSNQDGGNDSDDFM
ncbi:coiled-coil domain-containing protein 25-like [Amphibalanus amphitrite]|uniref:coiled-coil domain-containing protein 25-like n=1 Tax=Amphibalanus amphitrite TaxID=1232801 RepID=UPI001C91D7F3|nr:coiled-coil domain-containing protein 25-like [Amphibalanus amphitrite]XP_043215453.1 coiled-coil domain-containing protein 25-like [Amphibalanus amphitrite]XP_043215454.1 coiled-coil domain-containing protein 25-like [Amphibalanus amphitrite]XP_043215455.1 coiled-coil domain-containing protein 25-like [Amphibalanus amphitrite]XP_043215456.1 coiled-coil domain-containing protein 25-like [Amphibalanus amphitrite]XP_043215457.1 coiled-coil domain-containing protein 25-like [Amphibalanus amphi